MSRSGAALLAAEKGLIHIGLGNYTDKTGAIKFKSFDGITLEPIQSNTIKDTQKVTSIIATQKDPVLPNVLGEPSNIKSIQPKIKKKKSLVEFYNYTVDKREKNYNIKYRIPGTGNKQQSIVIKALNPKDAAAKAKAFIDRVQLIGTPQLVK